MKYCSGSSNFPYRYYEEIHKFLASCSKSNRAENEVLLKIDPCQDTLFLHQNKVSYYRLTEINVIYNTVYEE